MRDSTIAGNYADVLLAARAAGRGSQGWGEMFGDVAAAVEQDTPLRRVPRIPA